VETFGLWLKKDSFCFTAAHFLTFADGSREELHGHTYRLELRLEGDMDESGLLVDFLVLIPMVEKICQALDRRTILPEKNPHLEVSAEQDRVKVGHRRDSFTFPRRDTVLLALANTSTELLAAHLAREIRGALAKLTRAPALQALEVRLEESPGQGASCRLAFPGKDFCDPAPETDCSPPPLPPSRSRDPQSEND